MRALPVDERIEQILGDDTTRRWFQKARYTVPLLGALGIYYASLPKKILMVMGGCIVTMPPVFLTYKTFQMVSPSTRVYLVMGFTTAFAISSAVASHFIKKWNREIQRKILNEYVDRQKTLATSFFSASLILSASSQLDFKNTLVALTTDPDLQFTYGCRSSVEVEKLEWWQRATQQGHLGAIQKIQEYKTEQARQQIERMVEEAKECLRKNPSKNTVIEQRSYKLLFTQMQDAECMYLVACCNRDGTGVEQSLPEAFRYLEMAEKANHPMARYEYAIWNLEGRGCMPDPEKGMRLLLKSAATDKFPLSLYKLGILYESGEIEIARKNLFSARNYFKLAATLGHKEAMGKYAKFCFFKWGMSAKEEKISDQERHREAVGYWERSGDAESHYQLACRNEDGKGVKAKDPERVLFHLRQAVALGKHPDAQNRLSHLGEGRGVLDIGKMKNDVAKDPNPQVANFLAARYCYNSNLPPNIVDFLLEAERLGHPKAGFWLSYCFWNKEGVPEKDYFRSKHFFQRAMGEEGAQPPYNSTISVAGPVIYENDEYRLSLNTAEDRKLIWTLLIKKTGFISSIPLDHAQLDHKGCINEYLKFFKTEPKWDKEIDPQNKRDPKWKMPFPFLEKGNFLPLFVFQIEKMDIEEIKRFIAECVLLGFDLNPVSGHLLTLKLRSFTASSQMDATKRFDRKHCAITVIDSGQSEASAPNTLGGHAAVLVEKLTPQGGYSADKFHFVKQAEGVGRVVATRNILDMKTQHVAHKSETWIVKREDVDKWIRQIELEIREQDRPGGPITGYEILGGREEGTGKIYESLEEAEHERSKLDSLNIGYFKIRPMARAGAYELTRVSYNCMTWAGVRLEQIGIKLQPQRYQWLNQYIISLPVAYTR